MNSAIILCIGFLAQLFFSARVIVQWIMSEKAQQVLSPSLFWIFSMAGAYLLCMYGWLRDDFAVVLGQLIAYYIYIWNLKMKNVWGKIHWLLRILVFYTPIVAVCVVCGNAETHIAKFFHNDDIPLWLVLFGSTGQLMFSLRFIVQWYFSNKQGKSIFPIQFWIISIIGSLTIICYAILRMDIVLIVSQVSIIPYIRNLIISLREKKMRT